MNASTHTNCACVSAWCETICFTIFPLVLLSLHRATVGTCWLSMIASSSRPTLALECCTIGGSTMASPAKKRPMSLQRILKGQFHLTISTFYHCTHVTNMYIMCAILSVVWRLSEYNQTLKIKFCQLPWSPRSITNVVYVTRGNMTLKEYICIQLHTIFMLASCMW